MTDPCKTKCKTVSAIDKAACCGCPERYEYEKEMRISKENNTRISANEMEKLINKSLDGILFLERGDGSVATLKRIIKMCEERIKQIEEAEEKRELERWIKYEK